MEDLLCSFHEPSKVVIKDVSMGKDPEAQAKREHVKRFFSTGRDFTVNTHQKSVFYMFDNHLKNEKFLYWRFELSYFSF